MKPCAHCDAEFESARAMYCSTICKSRAYNARRSADGRLKAYREANAERIRDYMTVYNLTWRKSESGVDAIRAGYHKRRALLAGCEVERFNNTDVFERDAWMCGLCQEHVDSSLRYPDPLSASLDHIVPLSLGGDHTPANVQLAHWVCNVRKGNRAAA